MEKIQELDKCAAMVLMGCSSGYVDLNGSYAPSVVVYYYLLAGSSFVVANLWDLPEDDAMVFGKAMLMAWFKARFHPSKTSVQFSIPAEEPDALSLSKKRRRRAVKKDKHTKLEENMDSHVNIGWRQLGVGYFVSQSRNACKFPYLVGSAPVCYGVPIGIRNKKQLKSSSATE